MTTENTPQTSASERIEQAQKALAGYRGSDTYRVSGGTPEDSYDVLDAAEAMAEALRALITPPGVHESEPAIVKRVWDATPAHISGEGIRLQADDLFAMLRAAVRAGIQAAHETWEGSDWPSQEMMLRWLGIEYDEHADGTLHIREQSIAMEVI